MNTYNGPESRLVYSVKIKYLPWKNHNKIKVIFLLAHKPFMHNHRSELERVLADISKVFDCLKCSDTHTYT